ncbi:MAG: amidophosphoribosyltransferase [bacterium]
MSGFFGVVSRQDCVLDIFFGTDYHSHLGTMRGGLAVRNGRGIARRIHDITNTQFRSKFEDDLPGMEGKRGIGVVSDYEDQPLIIGSRLGTYAIVTVGRINNLEELVRDAFGERRAHFSEMSGGAVNPTEVAAMLINSGRDFADGIARAQEAIEGSCSILLLTGDGIYAARDRVGRTPLVLGRKEGAWAAASESASFFNLGYGLERDLGPGEVVLLTEEGAEVKKEPGDDLRICAFMWVYYGFPVSTYEGINVEGARYRCGEALARRDQGSGEAEPDLVAGVPDSGTAHAVGYANRSGIDYGRPFAKYTPTWPRSFMPQDQSVRDLVAKMKLLPVEDLIRGRRLLFCEDSIVRGTQLVQTIERIFEAGAQEVHMRPACPPLLFSCPYLNFSRSRSEMDLAGRRAVHELEGQAEEIDEEYLDPGRAAYAEMVDRIRVRLGLTSLHYQRMEDMVEAIGLPKEELCTYCWDRRG